MKYSCFEPNMGLYRVFEDATTLPVNADLPVPELPPDVNGIGVPSMLVGRPLPRGAREMGTSWQPQGIIVRCNSGFAGFGAYEEKSSTVKVIAGLAAVAAGAFLYYKVTSK